MLSVSPSPRHNQPFSRVLLLKALLMPIADLTRADSAGGMHEEFVPCKAIDFVCASAAFSYKALSSQMAFKVSVAGGLVDDVECEELRHRK